MVTSGGLVRSSSIPRKPVDCLLSDTCHARRLWSAGLVCSLAFLRCTGATRESVPRIATPAAQPTPPGPTASPAPATCIPATAAAPPTPAAAASVATYERSVLQRPRTPPPTAACCVLRAACRGELSGARSSTRWELFRTRYDLQVCTVRRWLCDLHAPGCLRPCQHHSGRVARLLVPLRHAPARPTWT